MGKGLSRLRAAACAVALLASGAAARAQEVVQIWPAPPPGTTWSGPETAAKQPAQPDGETPVFLSNVTTPTLTIFRPAPGKATGAAMIVCPGGGFQILAINYEGTDVGQWLADRGVTAFVLKYRVHMEPGGMKLPSSADIAAFDAALRAAESRRQIAVADGLQALRWVRANAARYGVAPDRVGIMGFSAGAMTTMGVVMDGPPGERPNLAAPIYGAMEDKPAPAGGPPVFVAAAADDPLVPPLKSLQIYSAWRQAKLPAELHIYETGGHGFGTLKHKGTSDIWMDDFENWLRAHHWIAAPAR